MSIDGQGSEYLFVDWLHLDFQDEFHFIFINTNKLFVKQKKLGRGRQLLITVQNARRLMLLSTNMYGFVSFLFWILPLMYFQNFSKRLFFLPLQTMKQFQCQKKVKYEKE